MVFLQYKRFCFVNHSQDGTLEQYHGRAINLNADDSRVPFHGAFLSQEMRVRGRWLFRADRPISLPIDWQTWIPTIADNDGDSDGDDGDNGNGSGGHGHGRWHGGGNGSPGPARGSTRSIFPSAMPPLLTPDSGFGNLNEDTSFSAYAATRQQPLTFTPTNPFTNPAELQAIKHSFSQQPNWKAAVVEGETWEGTAEDNIEKWQKLVGRS